MPRESFSTQLWKASLTYGIFVGAAVTGFFALYTIDSIFRISRITVDQRGSDARPIGIEAFYGAFSPMVQHNVVAGELKRQNPYIKKAEARVELPNHLVVFIETHRPVAALRGGQGYFLLADDGTILEKRREDVSGLPRILYYQQPNFALYQAGQKITFLDVMVGLFFLQKLREINILADTIDIQDYTMIRITANDRAYLFTLEKDRELQWYQMERLITELGISGQQYKRIDVRFEKPLYEPG